MHRPRVAVILAAGRGTRMKSPTPKVLFDVCGRSSLAHVVGLARALSPERILVVTGPDRDALAAEAGEGVEFVVQDPPRGTGDAVRRAVEALDAGSDVDVVVLYGDGPLLRGETLRGLFERHAASGAAETVLTAEVGDPHGFGRVIRAEDGGVAEIVEEIDASELQRAIREVNTGVIVFRHAVAREHLAALDDKNAKGEYYLTDLVHKLRAARQRVARVALEDPLECASFNSIAELANVRRILRERIVHEHMARGVDVVDPATAWIDVDVEIGPGSVILPCTVLGHGVRIGRGCVVGPFAHLRAGTVLEDGAEVGNFVEAKKSRLGAGAKAKHLTYLGDATVGARANVGAGTITANYDGKHKHSTVVGAGAFIGSGTVLIAPVEVGEDAVTGAGAIVTRNTRIGKGEVYVGVPARRITPRAAGAAKPAAAPQKPPRPAQGDRR